MPQSSLNSLDVGSVIVVFVAGMSLATTLPVHNKVFPSTIFTVISFAFHSTNTSLSALNAISVESLSTTLLPPLAVSVTATGVNPANAKFSFIT